MLRRIGLQNFKCWRELDIELAPITLFFGVNSSGKTAILESLLMLKQTAKGFDPGQHINFGGDENRDYVNLGSYQDLAFDHAADERVGINLSWETASHVMYITDAREVEEDNISSITYDVAWGIDQHIYVGRLRYKAELLKRQTAWVDVWRDGDSQYLLQTSFASEDDEPERVGSPQSCYKLPHTANYETRYGSRIASLRFEHEFGRLTSKIRYMGPLRARPNRYYPWTGVRPDTIAPDGNNAIDALIASSRSNEQLANNVAFGLTEIEIVEAFTIRTIDANIGLYEIKATIDGVESSLVDVGFGVSQVLPVIAMLMDAPKGSIVLLEQPELHLHPNAQAELADLLLDVAEKRDLQLIIESHSEHILRRFQRRIAEAESKFATPDNVRAYFCVPTDKGSVASDIKIDRFGQIANWPDKFLGDISGDLHTMAKAAIRRRREELMSE